MNTTDRPDAALREGLPDEFEGAVAGLRGRSLLSLRHHTPQEIQGLLDLATMLKQERAQGREQQRLRGRCIALIFEKSSTRTRCAFEVGAYEQGALVTYIDPTSSQLGHKESVEDTAGVLGRMYSAIEYRGCSQSAVEALASHSGVPVFNGLTDDWHPTQMLADLLTMSEYSARPLREISYAYVGDARNNMGNSLLMIGALMGMDVRIGAPRSLWPSQALVADCHGLAAQTGARILLSEDVRDAVRGVDFVHTDVWVSMGEPEAVWEQRIEQLRGYQVNDDLLAATGNPRVRFMHCLPAFHDTQTEVGRWVADRYPELSKGVEVTDAVFRGPCSIVMDQAENRLHTIKAVMVAALATVRDLGSQ